MDTRKEIRGYEAVREAARDWETYSSDLLGDRDVRDYRQLPLEADPPRHTKFRMALQPIFAASALREHVDAFESLARRLMSSLSSAGSFDVGRELALPYVIGCLSIIYRRPQDYEEWLAWGPDVWTAESYRNGESAHEAAEAHRNRDFSGENQRSGVTLQRYLDQVFDEAEARVAAGLPERDIWDTVAGLEIDGERVNRKEMQGIANVLLAGGRDTVIKLLTGFVWHLTGNPSDAALMEAPENFRGGFQEMVRFLTPLPRMERVPREYAVGSDASRDPNNYVLLGFVSANFDGSRFLEPERIDFKRERNAHVGFGAGPHVCLGQNITEAETSAFIRVLLEFLPNWSLEGSPDIAWVNEPLADGSTARYLDRFNLLRIRTK